MPPMVTDLEIPKPTPLRSVPIPRVTIRDETPMRTTRKALSDPMISPTTRVATIAGMIAQPWLTLRNATIVAEKPMTEATDRSNSPAVSDTINPSVMTS